MQTNDTTNADVRLSAAGDCCGGHPSCCRRAARDPLALAVAILMVAVLGFATFAKFYAPNPKELALEYSVGVAESFVILAALVFHRRWWMWSGLAIMWAGLAGWSFFKSWHGEACGCFSTLWEPPPYTTGTLDSVFAVISLGLAARRGAGGRHVLGAAALAILAGLIGWMAADAKTPPRRVEVAQVHGGKEARHRLLESDLMADIREQPEGGPAWLIFVYDPDCHICEGIKPFMEFLQAGYEETGDPVMQIRMFSIPDLEKETGIETYAWETPTIFIVHSGHITRTWKGKEVEGWTDQEITEIYEQVAAGEHAEPEQPGSPAPE